MQLQCKLQCMQSIAVQICKVLASKASKCARKFATLASNKLGKVGEDLMATDRQFIQRRKAARGPRGAKFFAGQAGAVALVGSAANEAACAVSLKVYCV